MKWFLKLCLCLPLLAPPAADTPFALLGGVAFGLNIVLFYSALKATSVANAVIISAFQPVLVMAVSGRLFGEKVALRMLGLVAIALSGVVLVVFGGAGGGDPSLQGDLLAAAATFAWAAYFIGSKGARAHLDAVTYQTSLLIIAAITVTPIALVVGGGGIEAPRGDDLWWIVLMVLGPGSGHLLMNWVHGHLPLALTSTLTLALPGLSAIGAAIFLDEPVAALQALGMAVVVVALGAAIVADARITSARLARGLNRA